MGRITENDIRELLKTFNSIIEDRGIKVVLGGRYGYQALDLYSIGGSCLKNITNGTKKEVLEFIQAMTEGISLSHYKVSEFVLNQERGVK